MLRPHRPTEAALAELMDESYDASERNDLETVRAKVQEYRKLYAANVENLK